MSTPLRTRMIEDMKLRGFAPGTVRGYVHHIEHYAKYFWLSPEKLDLEAVRQFELYLLEERKLSPESINQFVSAAKFLYLTTLEMPWGPVLDTPQSMQREQSRDSGLHPSTSAPIRPFGFSLFRLRTGWLSPRFLYGRQEKPCVAAVAAPGAAAAQLSALEQAAPAPASVSDVGE